MLFTLLLVTRLVLFTPLSALVLVVISWTVYFYTFELEDFLFFNSVTSVTTPQTQLFNNLLTNLLNKYHPAIFYASVVLLLTSMVIYEARGASTTRGTAIQLQTYHNSYWGPVLWYNLIALTLGSWWALQEGTWGGWWNWDSSETLGLLVTLTVLFTLHNTLTKYSTLRWLYLNKTLVYLFIFSYFFIQLNFEIVSHNFNFKIFHFFNTTSTLVQFCFVALYLAILPLSVLLNKLQLTWYCSSRYTTLVTYSRQLRTVLVYISFAPFLLLPVISYIPILNYFTWNFFNLTLFYHGYSFEWLGFFVLISLLYHFGTFQFLTSTVSLTTVASIFYSTYSYLLFSKNQLSNFHFLLIMFFMLNLTALYANYLVKDLGEVMRNSVNFTTCLVDKQPLYMCQDGLVEHVHQTTDNLNSVVSTWNVSGTSNAFEVADFTLLLQHTNLVNFYHINVDWFANLLFIELHNMNSLIFVTFFLYLKGAYVWQLLLCVKPRDILNF